MDKNIISKKINDFKNREKFSDLKLFIIKLLKNNKNDHWLLCQLALACYNLYEYKDALKYSNIAYNEFPDCPLVLEQYGISLYANENPLEAITIFNKLYEKDIDEIAYSECGEGKNFALSLKNDIRVRIALCYLELEQNKMAENFLKEHLKNRRRGLFSSFSKKYVLMKIKQK